MHHPTDRITHTTFVAPVVEHWLEREIAQWIDPTTHHIMSERSYHGATSRSLVAHKVAAVGFHSHYLSGPLLDVQHQNYNHKQNVLSASLNETLFLSFHRLDSPLVYSSVNQSVSKSLSFIKRNYFKK